MQNGHLRLSQTSKSYGRFVPHEYLRFLSKESIIDVELGDHVSKEMAVMFSDISSFTTLSESMTPQENFDFVNVYLRQVSPVIRNLKLQTLANFENGLENYRCGDCVRAKVYFEKVLAVNAEDKAASLYLERVEELQQKGIPEDWCGVWSMTKK